ncbi:MAG: hypothetical protein HYU69_00725 [Bacteroidetes bacterium]|nr:hypothetical protein [Bacteroidota bacterium]
MKFNNSKETLFDLIKSLTPSEKKSLTLYINYYSTGDKKYLHLFEMIDSTHNYDERIIGQKLKDKNILTPLPKIKNYLLALILKALRFHYSGKSIEGKIRDYFADIEICHNKGLKTLRNNIIKKTKKLTGQFEKQEARLQVLNKEWGLGLNLQKDTALLIEQEQISVQIASVRTYKSLIYSVHKLLKHGDIRDKMIKTEWIKIIKHPLMISTNEPTDFESNYYYHTIYNVYYEKLNEFKKGRDHLETLLKNMESRPELLMEHVAKYMSVLNNFVAILCANKELNRAEDILNKLLLIQNWKLGQEEKNILTDNITIAYSNLLFGYLLVKAFDAGERMAQDAIFFMQTHNARVVYKTALFVNLSGLYLYTGNYYQARIWNNNILNELPGNCREGDYVIAKILNLIIHYELEQDDLLTYIVRSTYLFLLKRKRLYKTEDVLLRFIRNKLPGSNSRKELINFFKDLKMELQEITKDPFEAKALEYFDFISWLDSKIQNRPFMEVVKEKARLSAK